MKNNKILCVFKAKYQPSKKDVSQETNLDYTLNTNKLILFCCLGVLGTKV